MWDEIKRFEYPHRYYVDLSESLWTLKTIMLNDFERKIRQLTHK